MSLAVRHKVILTDYELTTTLGTGTFTIDSHDSTIRFLWPSVACEAQEDRRVLRDEATQESGHHQAASSRSRDQ